MADDLGISEAQILGLFLASVFWGMLLITFVQVMKCLLWDIERGELKPTSKINWPMLIIALLLMAFSTFDVSIGLMHCIEAFVLYTGPGGSAARFTGLTDWVNILKTCNVEFGKMISDGVLVYRCWVICNHRITVVVLPILLWLGGFSTAIFIIYLEASAKNPKILLTGGSSKLTPSITANWSISLANNIITTGVIVYKIWSIDRSNTLNGNHHPSGHTKRNKRTELQNVIRIIIESGMMYTAIALITFITFLVGSSSFYPTSDVELQILSIAFNLIIIRARTRPDPNSSSYNTNAQFAIPQIYPLHSHLPVMELERVDTELDTLEPSMSEGPTEPGPSLSDVESGDCVVADEQ
ncbi:hypothetical protein EV361DRAFT_802561 [Lentinula raphanica]|nr:hypothetical protein EV361DRAFT_802561 [Lentinula raphanica]